MPTENRSSNTEMVSVPRQTPEYVLQDGSTKREVHAAFLQAQQSIRTLLDQPAQQPHPEPIAWMVGTAFWWTKEEAERDAAATGLPIVGLGPMSCIAPAEQHQGEPVALPARKPEPDELSDVFSDAENAGFNECLDEITKLGPLYTHADHGEVERLRADLSKARAILNTLASGKGISRLELDPYLSDPSASSESSTPSLPRINGHKFNCKAVDDYKPGECSCGAEPSDECAHSYANGLGCPECGEKFGAEPSVPVCDTCDGDKLVVTGFNSDAGENIEGPCPACTKPSAPVDDPDDEAGQERVAVAAMPGPATEPHCKTCNDEGAVGNILDPEPCPDCAAAPPVER